MRSQQAVPHFYHFLMRLHRKQAQFQGVSAGVIITVQIRRRGDDGRNFTQELSRQALIARVAFENGRFSFATLEKDLLPERKVIDHQLQHRTQGVLDGSNVPFHKTQELSVLRRRTHVLQDAQKPKHQEIANRGLEFLDLLSIEKESSLGFFSEGQVDDPNVWK